jgi:hypothetical protein
MIVEINFFSVFFDVESEYGIGLSLTITIFALEGVAIIFSNPVYKLLIIVSIYKEMLNNFFLKGKLLIKNMILFY